ncbi:MAG: VWA domain-containing protein [Candidatus Acidiferrum sp.]
MRFHSQWGFLRTFFVSVALLFVASSFPRMARAQESSKLPASKEQSASNTPSPVIKTESRIVLVDAVVTDKKGNYIRDLTQQDFKVYEDNKEQAITSFSFGSDVPAGENRPQRHYVILFFDNASMQRLDQVQARKAAATFIEQNAAGDRVMAIAEFGGTLQVTQDFTSNPELLKSAISVSRTPHMETNSQSSSIGGSPLNLAASASDLGARSMFLSIRTLAMNLRSIAGRKTLILFSAGFPLMSDPTRLAQLTATIDACNKANVTVYSLDVRALAASVSSGSPLAPLNAHSTTTQSALAHRQTPQARPSIVRVSYFPDPQKPGGGSPGGGGGTPGGGIPAGPNGSGKRYSISGNQARSIVPQLPASVDINQYLLRAIAEGTGGFVILNTNDLLNGLNRIARELNEFYVLGYVPQSSQEGACHTLKVKLDRSGAEVRSRSGYCNTRAVDPLEGKPLEKQLENEANGAPAGSILGSMQVPYFYNGPNIARVNMAIDVPSDSLNFSKDKGDYHSDVNVLGIAYKQDGTVAARFSDTLEFNLQKDEWKVFTKQPYHYQNQFDLAPGSYKLAVVFSTGGDHFGKFETPIQIAPYLGNTLTLGGVVLSTDFQKLNQDSSQLDAMLLEDRTPLVANGVQITPAAKYQFKKSDKVVLYSELYEPLLKNQDPPKIGAGYVVFDKATNKEVASTGAIPLDEFIQKGNTVVPFTLILRVSDWPPGAYRLVLQAVDGASNRAPQKGIEFTVSD